MTMKLGVLQFFSWPGRHGPLEEVYARALERIEIMDRGGFDAVWLAEHHFTTFSVCPSVHMLGTLAAARTRLRIGTAVSLAALYHPLRLAEEVALLDMLSGGRVNWGAGRGFAHSEFNAFGVPPEESAERFREAVEIVLKAWTEERFSYRHLEQPAGCLHFIPFRNLRRVAKQNDADFRFLKIERQADFASGKFDHFVQHHLAQSFNARDAIARFAHNADIAFGCRCF